MSPSRFARLAEYIDRATTVTAQAALPPIPAPAGDVSRGGGEGVCTPPAAATNLSHPVTGTTEFKGRYLPGDATARASSPPARAVAGWDVHEKETT